VLHPERPQEKVLEKTETTAPSGASPPPLRAEPTEPTPETAPSPAAAVEAPRTVAPVRRRDRSKLFERTQTTSPGEAPSQPEAIEAARTVAQFLRGDPSVEIELAKQAQAIVSEFIAERERLMSARDD
jgi:hypothetical protein